MFIPCKEWLHYTMPSIDSLYQVISNTNYQPLNRDGLLRRLKVPTNERAKFFSFLDEEVAAGRLVSIRNGLYVQPIRVGLVAGKLHMNERGFGFLLADNYDGADIYIAREDTANAFHGDRVLVRLNESGGRNNRRGGDRTSGQVIKVLQRARTQLVGTLQQTKLFYYVVPDDTRIIHDVYVPKPKISVPVGHKVVVKLHDWPSRNVNPEGVVTEVLGPPEAPGVDMMSVIRKYELPTEFPNDVVEQASRISTAIPPQEIKRREDFRKHLVFTVDPDDARDFDDALSFIELRNGDIEVFVHIADVSHYVTPGSALDREAQKRGNSVYLADRVIPMLPEKLSNGICSLQPQVDRLVKTVVVRLDKRGKVLGSRFAEGVIHSRQRLTYQQAIKLIQKPSPSPIGRAVLRLHEMAQILRKKRFAAGSLDLDFPDIKVRLDAEGRPVKLERMDNDESHQLIEEYMLLANEAVASHLKEIHRPAVYRVHEHPDSSRLEELRVQLKFMGINVGNLSQRGEIQKMLKRVKGTAEESVVKINLLKSLMRARYDHRPTGHFGLAKANYTHFTSPIRRYADLLVHRALFARNPKDYGCDISRLAQIAISISQTERNAAEAEQESVKQKKLQYFLIQSKQTKSPEFKANVIEVKSIGLLVELSEFQVQGLVRISDIPGDIYIFDPQRHEIVGRRNRAVFHAGQSLPVKVMEVDLVRKQINFTTVPRSGRF
jgi:ribonuclease R